MINYTVYDPKKGKQLISGSAPTRQDISSGEGFEYIILPGKLEACSLDQVKAAIWERVKERKAEILSRGIVTELGVLDGNLESQITMTRLIADAVRDIKYSAPVTFADNVTKTLSATEILSIGSEYSRFLNAVHEVSQTLRVAISKAKTVTAAMKIDTLSVWSK